MTMFFISESAVVGSRYRLSCVQWRINNVRPIEAWLIDTELYTCYFVSFVS